MVTVEVPDVDTRRRVQMGSDRPEPGMDDLWDALRTGLSEEAEQLLLRLLRVHARFLAEVVNVAVDMTE